jgi:DNA-binding helix-hairpin-helix protein with protein kinase domain
MRPDITISGGFMNTTTKTTQCVRLNQHIVLGRPLARGGEGTIFEIDSLSGDDPQKHVAKVYFKPSAERTAKLEAMLANVPTDPTYHNPKTLGHISIAWPKALLLNEHNECIGFIMPYINQKETFPLLSVYNPQDRMKIRVYNEQKQREVICEFTWKYLWRMAYNLAEIVKELHSKDYVVGDLNESNILVTATALVTLVDCDSMQVPRPKLAPDDPTTCFRCPVGKPEYTPSELQGIDFSQTDRVQNNDNFGLAVLIFLLLMEGRHPFAGAWHGDGPPHPIVQNIREYNFPYVGSGQLRPPKNALSLGILPPEVQELVKRCFAAPPSSTALRPTAQEWAQTLEKAETGLKKCWKHPLHVYYRKKFLIGKCPWCARMKLGIPDPFPSAKQAKKPASKPTTKLIQASSPKKTRPLSPLSQGRPSVPSNRSFIPPSRPTQRDSSVSFSIILLYILLYVAEILFMNFYLWSAIPSLWQHGPVIFDIALIASFFIPALIIVFIRSSKSK